MDLFAPKDAVFVQSTDVYQFERSVNYQASIIALQLFLQRCITQDCTVDYDAIVFFYLRRCSTVADFLAYRTVLVYHEDDERDGSEDDTPLTCGRAQLMFENVEAYLHTFKPEDFRSDNPMAAVESDEVFTKPEFKRIVDAAFNVLTEAYKVAVDGVVAKLFFDTNATDVMVDAARCVLRASVLGTGDYFKPFSDLVKENLTQFRITLNKDLKVQKVEFESFEWIQPEDLKDVENFVDVAIVLKTDDDYRLQIFYDYAREYITDAFDLYRFMQATGLKRRREDLPEEQTTNL
jgi:hypothetical protein